MITFWYAVEVESELVEHASWKPVHQYRPFMFTCYEIDSYLDRSRITYSEEECQKICDELNRKMKS